MILQTYLEEQFFNVRLDEELMHEYQHLAVQFLYENPYSAAFMDLGLGKTLTILSLLVRLSWEEAFEKALIIAPLRVITQTWPTELKQWSHTAALSYTLLRHKGNEPEIQEVTSAFDKEAWKQFHPSFRKFGRLQLSRDVTKAEARVRARLAMTPTPIHMISREQVEWLVELHGEKWPYDTVVFDESSGLKDWKTNRWEALRYVRPKIKRFHQLTATPASETYLHLFPQIYLLDLGQRLGRKITHFRKAYFSYNKYNRLYTLLPGAEEKISAKIADICLVMRAEDYLSQDKPLIIHRPVQLSPDEMKTYRTFEDEFVLNLPPEYDVGSTEGVTIEAKTAAALCNKLLQYASGAVYDENKKVHAVHDHKIEELKQIIEEAQGKPILVAYWFQSSLDRLKKAFPHMVVMDKNGKAVGPWNAGKIQLLAVHPASAGHGLNLQYGGHILAFFEIPWSLELFLQLIGRLARQGQKFVVRVFLIYAKGTLEEYVIEKLTLKEQAQEILFSWIKKIRRMMKCRS